jgi:hypothetical protein
MNEYYEYDYNYEEEELEEELEEEEEEEDQEKNPKIYSDSRIETPFNKSCDILHNLTLELMINKKHYKRILEKIDNKKFQQMNDDDNKIQYHFADIMSITKELLINHNNPKYGNDVTLSFTTYLQNCLNHIEKERDVYKETDVIFESLNEKSNYIPSNVSNCWGKAIKKSH